MPTTDQTMPRTLADEIRLANEGFEPDEHAEAIRKGLAYSLPMSPTERVQRHDQAWRVAERLNAIAARHGIRSCGWMIVGPAEDGAPPLPELDT